MWGFSFFFFDYLKRYFIPIRNPLILKKNSFFKPISKLLISAHQYMFVPGKLYQFAPKENQNNADQDIEFAHELWGDKS